MNTIHTILRRASIIFALCACALGLPAHLCAQVVELQAGGSSLSGGAGGTANFWMRKYEATMSIGYLDGIRAGASLRTTIGSDTLRLGNDDIDLPLPTDVFSNQTRLLVQGIGIRHGSGGNRLTAFAGASATAMGSQFFTAARFDEPMAAVLVERRVAPTLKLTTQAVLAERQTFIQGAEWMPAEGVRAALAGGVGANEPYGATSLTVRRDWVDAKAAFVRSGDGFRRTFVTGRRQSELDRENVSVTLTPVRGVNVSAARYNFVQPGGEGEAVRRSTSNQLSAGASVAGFALNGGVNESWSDGQRSVTASAGVGRSFTDRLRVDAMMYRGQPAVGEPISLTSARLTQRLTPKLSLLQFITHSEGSTDVSLGGALQTNRFGATVDYQIRRSVWQDEALFARTLALGFRVQLGGYRAEMNTHVTPDGQVNYTGSGGTFVYMGSGAGAPQSEAFPRMGRYVVRGQVRDQAGKPVDGAALDVGGERVYSNGVGEFMIRTTRMGPHTLRLMPAEFLAPGTFTVVSAPATVTAMPDGVAQHLAIVLQRATPAAATVPDTAARTEPRPATPAVQTALPEPRPTPAPAPHTGSRNVAGRVGIGTVRFAAASAVLNAEARAVLNDLAVRLAAHPGVRLRIEGHTDATGSRTANQLLSVRRAAAMREYLVARGVAPARLAVSGFGASRPVATNASAAGRALNRRGIFTEAAGFAPAASAGRR